MPLPQQEQGRWEVCNEVLVKTDEEICIITFNTAPLLLSHNVLVQRLKGIFLGHPASFSTFHTTVLNDLPFSCYSSYLSDQFNLQRN